MKMWLIIILTVCFAVCQGCSAEKTETGAPSFLQELRNQRRQIPLFGTERNLSTQKAAVAFQKLLPLHQEINASNLTDWERRFQTAPQDLQTYLQSNPIQPASERPYIYVGKLGTFTPAQNEIFQLTCLYLQGFYGCEVRYLDSIPLSEIPKSAKRLKDGKNQIYTRYILDDLIKPRLPDSALNGLLLSSSDLFPASNWRFVFGQASLKNRVGVWSMARFGDANASREAFNLCLKRTLKTAAHETGHMFSMKHCTFYFCTMQGAYHLEEADARPMYVCPICLSKLSSGGHIDVLARFQFLEKFWRMLGFEEESNNYRRFLHTITS